MDARYPTGPFTHDAAATPEKRAGWVAAIAECPGEVRRALAAIPAHRLDTPYREGGWTARQVVHHLADSHLNAYVRFRLTLTEHEPMIKPYAEAAWAELVDARSEDPSVSLAILEGVHRRLDVLLRSLQPADFARTAHHAERGSISVDWLLQMYAWHGRHHIGHLGIVAARG
jgi:hypothetical protein